MNFILLAVAYLLGSIPFSLILGLLFQGKDIRKYGSGNLGTTNAFRVFGRPIGFAVLFADTLKSGLIVFLILHTRLFDGVELFHPVVYGVASVLGHCFPVWLSFKGGKGVASSFGLLLAYEPLLALGLLGVFLVTEYLTRYVSVSSTVGALSAVLFVTLRHFLWKADLGLVIATAFVAAVIVYRHRANYRRLRAGTENKVHLFDLIDRFFKKAS
ncbi:MAG: glycerol-3-phosphate 1-O-acyltransferase PlsY [Candidatus Izemoplasmatales bacterium]